MPIVPRVNPQVRAIGELPGVRNRTQVDANPLGGLADATRGFAAMANEFAQKEKKKNDLTAVMAARRRLSEFEGQLFDPENPEGVHAYKGINALGVNEAVIPKLDAVRSEIMAGFANDDQRAAFEQVEFSFRDSLVGRLNGHAQREHEVAIKAMQAGSLSNLQNDAVAAAQSGDFGLANARLQEALAMNFAAMDADGMPAEFIKGKEREMVSGFHSAVASGMLADDALEAQAYIAEHRGQFLPGAIADLERTLAPLVLDAAASDLVDSWEFGGPAEQGDREAVWATRIQAESGGRQFGKDGKPLTSSAGAIGRAQVMPATAKRVAEQMLGEAFDEARYRSDPSYNEKLGKTYFDWLWDRFDGNPVLASAAYNAGEGAVDKWIRRLGDPRKGEISTEDFAARIPFKETRDYVKSVPGVDAPRNPGAGNDKATMLERAAGIRDPRLRRAAEQEVRGRAEIARLRQEESDRAFLESVNIDVWTAADPNVPLPKLLGPERYAEAARRGILGALENDLLHRRANKTQVDDPGVVGAYFDTLRQNPDAFARMDVMKNARHMTPATREALLKKQGEVRSGKSAEDATEKEQLEFLVYRPLGVNAGDDASKNTRALLESAWFDMNRDWVRRHDKQPDATQREAMLVRLRTSFALKGVSGKGIKAIPAQPIPADQRSLIVESLRKRGIAAPSEDDIIDMYLQAVGK